MEGVSHEACSLAGTLGLGKLIVFYDDNGISIDGKVVGWFTDDTPKRFAAYGWHVLPDVDGLDGAAVAKAHTAARAEHERPSLICCKTIIGYGAPDRQGTKEAHGEALGAEEVQAGAQDARLAVPAVRGAGRDTRRVGSPQGRARSSSSAWRELFARYASGVPRSGARVRAAHARGAARRTGGDTPRQDACRSCASRARRRRHAPSSQAALNVHRHRRCRSSSAAPPI